MKLLISPLSKMLRILKENPYLFMFYNKSNYKCFEIDFPTNHILAGARLLHVVQAKAPISLNTSFQVLKSVWIFYEAHLFLNKCTFSSEPSPASSLSKWSLERKKVKFAAVHRGKYIVSQKMTFRMLLKPNNPNPNWVLPGQIFPLTWIWSA